MRTHVTLVNPPYPSQAHQHPPFIPLGIGYLAAVLEKAHFKVSVIDCQALKLTHEQFRNELSKHPSNVVGITSTTLTYNSALEVARIAKEVYPSCFTILGGCHATFWDEEALQECPQLDMIARKEGEYTMLELVERVEAGRELCDVVGTTCRKGQGVIRNPDRPYIEDLDSLPFPAHHLLPLSTFQRMGRTIFPLTTSRGCVYWCNFCSAVRMFGKRYRMRDPRKVVDEMQFLNEKYGATQFTFYDDAFTVNQSRAEKICEELQSRGLKLAWDCETRVDMVTKDLLRKMKKAGCLAVWFGVESGSQNVIDSMGKSIRIAQTRRAFKWANDVGLMTVASVILGFPGETKESAWETVKFLEGLNPSDVGYYVATPYPGTPMYDYVKEMGWLRVHDFNKYDTATPVFETPTMRMQELREIREQAFQRFYLRPTHVLRMFSKGGMYGIYTSRTAFAHLIRAVKAKL